MNEWMNEWLTDWWAGWLAGGLADLLAEWLTNLNIFLLKWGKLDKQVPVIDVGRYFQISGPWYRIVNCLNTKRRDMSVLRGSAHQSKIPTKRFHWLRNQRAFFFMLTCSDFLACLISELNFYFFRLRKFSNIVYYSWKSQKVQPTFQRSTGRNSQHLTKI